MTTFTFRPIARGDFALLSGWLATAHVARWWNDDPALAAIEHDYGPCVDGIEPAHVFIASLDGRDLGLIQRYRFAAYPGYCAELAPIVRLPARSSGIDYLIGPPPALGKGLGTAMIAAFVAQTWTDDPDTTAIVVPVQAGNRASWRALERAGFLRVAEGDLAPDNPADGPEHVIYAIARPAS